MKLLAILLLAGCGRVAFDAVSDARADSNDAAHVCVTWGAFGPLVDVPDLDGVSETDYDPTETADRLQIFYVRGNDIPFDIYVAKRASVADPYELQGKANFDDVAASDIDPSITADGLDLVFASDRSGSARPWEVTRASVSDDFGPPAIARGFEALAIDDQLGLDLAANGLVLYTNIAGVFTRFARPDRASAFVETGSYATGRVQFPDMRDDELELFEDDGAQGRRIHTRTRASTADEFGAAVVLDFGLEIYDPFLESDPASMLVGANNNFYRTTRSCAD